MPLEVRSAACAGNPLWGRLTLAETLLCPDSRRSCPSPWALSHLGFSFSPPKPLLTTLSFSSSSLPSTVCLSLSIPHSFWILSPSFCTVFFLVHLSPPAFLGPVPITILLGPLSMLPESQGRGDNRGGMVWEACESPIFVWGLVSSGWKFSFFVADQGGRNGKYKWRKHRICFASPELT